MGKYVRASDDGAGPRDVAALREQKRLIFQEIQEEEVGERRAAANDNQMMKRWLQL